MKPGERQLEAAPPVVVQLGGAEANSASAFSVGVLWNALCQRLAITLPLAIVTSCAACAALWYGTEDKFRSTSTLKIVDQQPFIAFQTSGQSTGFAQTQVELLRNRHIINTAVDSANLQEIPELRKVREKEDPIQWITQRLKVARIGQSELYEVSFIARYAESAQRVVAAVVKAYTDYQASQSDQQRQFVLQRLNEEQAIRLGAIERQRENVRKVTRQVGGEAAALRDQPAAAVVPQLSSQRMAVMASLRQRLVEAEVDLEIKRARATALRGATPQRVYVSDDEIDTAISQDPQTIVLEGKLRLLRGELQALDKKNPKYASKQAAIDELEKELKAHKEKSRPVLRKQGEESIAAQQQDLLMQSDLEVENLEKLVALLNEKIDGEKKEQTRHGDNSLVLEFARSELEHAEAVSRRISERIVHLTTESRAPSQVEVVERATFPEFPEGPSLTKKLAMVGVGGFLAPFALFIGWDLLFRRIYEREQLQKEVKVRFVSEVAALPTRPVLPRFGGGAQFKQQTMLFEESVNSLRTTLAVDKSLENAQVFVMASAVSGEGKTNLSSQLAMSWSQAEPGKVIIVDGDLRSPNVHELFEVQSGPGLAEVLRGECRIEDATIMDWGDRLYIMPAGDLKSQSASQLFSGPRFLEVMTKLRKQYRRIVVDVPPVLCASESLLIARQADAVLMCALHDHSRAGQFKQAYERLQGAGVNIVGAVLNGAPVRQYSYAYRGYGVN